MDNRLEAYRWNRNRIIELVIERYLRIPILEHFVHAIFLVEVVGLTMLLMEKSY